MPDLDGVTANVARSSSGETDGVLSKLPGIPVASIKTAAELDLAAKASKPLVLRGLFEHWPSLAAGRSSPSALNDYLKSMDPAIPGPALAPPPSPHAPLPSRPDPRA